MRVCVASVGFGNGRNLWKYIGFNCLQRQIVEKDCRARGLNREDAMDRARWRKLIGMIDDYDESSG